MRRQYDFSKAKRAKGRTRITIMLDSDLLMAFKVKVESEGTG
jgi:predicted DNA binding CopG/RHH family protein